MKCIYCSAILFFAMQFSYAQHNTRTGIPVRIVQVPVLTDSLGKINDYTQPISKKINDASKELNQETLKLVEEWRNVVKKPSIKFEKLVLTFSKKFAKITNSNTAGYIDSLSIRLGYIDRKMLQNEIVYTFDIRMALNILANEFDHATNIRNYIQQRKKGLHKIEKQLKEYDAKVLKIKEQFSTPLKIEIAYNEILQRDTQYQSFMQEMVLLGTRYGIFGKM